MIGETVSHFKIVKQLGAGGMGVVYEALDLKLDRPVALKFLPPDLTRDPAAKARFVHEAKAASALDHPSVCTIYEIDESDDGRLFIAMARYEGETLKERIARGPLPLDEAVDITRQMAEGLARAHECDIVHRDIKPANVMVTSDDVVKIVDFGLAKLAGQTRVTKTGTTVGTAAYMSPEQAQGGDIDERTDIWSTGCVLYELLTGRLPFAGDREVAVVYGIINTDPAPLSEHRSDLPEGLQGIVDRCLAKDVNDRYGSAVELKNDLEEVRDSITHGRRAVLKGRGARGLSKRGWRRRGLLAAAAVLIVAGVFTVTRVMQTSRSPVPDEASLAIVDFGDLVTPDDPVVSAEITGLLYVGLVESSPVRVVSPDLLHDLRRRSFGSARGPIGEDQILEVARKSGATHLLSGQVKAGQFVMWRLVDTRNGESLAAHRIDGANLVEVADRIIAAVIPALAAVAGAEVTEPPQSVSTMTTESREAYSHYTAGMLAMENIHFGAAVDEFESAVALDSSFALAYFGLSKAQTQNQAELGPARRSAELAWHNRTGLAIKDRMRLEAWRARVDDRIPEAIGLYREMLARWPDDYEVLSDFIDLMFRNGDFHDLVPVARQGSRLYPDDWALANWLANGLGVIGKLQEALDVSRAYAERNPSVARVWHEVGQRYYEMALPDSAEMAFRRALAIDPTFWNSDRHISYCHYCRGDVEQAIEIQTRLSTRDDILPGLRGLQFWYVGSRPGLPTLYIELGQFDNALASFENAAEFASTNEGRVRIGARRSRILLRMGKAREVLDWAGAAKQQADTRRAVLDVMIMEAWALAAVDSIEAARTALPELEDLVEWWGQANEVFAVRVSIELEENGPDAALAMLAEWNRRGRYRVGGLDDIEYRELTARAHRMAGRLDEAARVHEEMLRVYRGHFLSHYDLGQIYEEMGRTSDAKKAYSVFLEAWSNADEGLPQLKDARARLAALDAGL